MQALSAQLRDCFILGYEFHRATAHAAMRCHRANHDRTQNRLTMSIDVAFVTGFLCKETRNIQLGAYMQASGAVSRVRQARTGLPRQPSAAVHTSHGAVTRSAQPAAALQASTKALVDCRIPAERIIAADKS